MSVLRAFLRIHPGFGGGFGGDQSGKADEGDLTQGSCLEGKRS